MGDSPVVLEIDLCKACGICIEICPDKVFDRDKFGYPVLARPEECSQCLLCELHCPDFALEVKRRAKKQAKATAGAPELSRDALVAATTNTLSPEEICDHDSEG
jgi:2-oxoglutarate ferredoxin oxidoreductase subunit delta